MTDMDGLSQTMTQVSKPPDTPWTQLDKMITEHVDRHEIPDCEGADGNSGDYHPTEWERVVVMDAIQGILGDDEILDKIFEAREYTKKLRREAGECERCGRKLPDHWGGCSQADAGAGRTDLANDGEQ